MGTARKKKGEKGGEGKNRMEMDREGEERGKGSREKEGWDVSKRGRGNEKMGGQCHMAELRLPFSAEEHHLYSTWWQRHMRINGLPKVAT